VSNSTDLANYFKFEIWSPQGLPQDAYTGAAFYQAPQFLYWTVIEPNNTPSRQPSPDQNFIRIPFLNNSEDPRDFARRWSAFLLLDHVRDWTLHANYTSTNDYLIDTLRVRNNDGTTIKVLTFSDDLRNDIEYRVNRCSDLSLSQAVEYPQLEPSEGIDLNTVLVFTNLGKIVCSVYSGCGIAFCNWGITVIKLPPVPKTRYSRVLEGQVI
jgi:hypothetical protein